MIIKHNKFQIPAILTLSSLLAGSIASAQTNNQSTVRPAVAAKGQRGAMGPLEMMKQSLSLTDEQARKLEAVMSEQQAKVAALRGSTSLSRQDKVAKLKEIGVAADPKVKGILTPEQVGKWQKMRSNQQTNAGTVVAKGQLGTNSPTQVMKRALNLTDVQGQKLEAVMKDQQAKVAAVRGSTDLSRQDKVAKMKEIWVAADSQVKGILTPEQVEKWQRMRPNQRANVGQPGMTNRQSHIQQPQQLQSQPTQQGTSK